VTLADAVATARRRTVSGKFWQDRWQQREEEVDEHVAAERVTVYDFGESFVAQLDRLDAEVKPDAAALEVPPSS
jgi:hypothetical protein